MMSPESRRSLRNLAMVVVVFVLLWFAWEWSKRLDNSALLTVSHWAMGIIGLFALSVGFENGLRALKLHAGKDGLDIEAGGEQ